MTGAEITCLCWDSTDERDPIRLAIGTRDRVVQVWTFDTRRQILPMFSVQLDITVPGAICFIDNTAKDVQVFGVFDGNVYVILSMMISSVDTCYTIRHVLGGGDGKVVSSRKIGTIM